MSMALSDAWGIVKRLESLLELEAKHGKAIAWLEADDDALERRLVRLEHREELVLVEARAAARTGAADAMQGVILQIGERLAAIEAKAPPKRVSRRRPAPEA